MADGDTIKLYSEAFWISPYVFSVYVTLKEKGLPFEVATVHLEKREQRQASYRERFLIGKVPALEHRGFCLTESSAIVEYLEDVFPAPQWKSALPRDPRDRARARQIMAWIRSDHMPLREERPTTTMFYERATRPLSEAGETAAQRLLEACHRLIPEGRTSLFADWSIADSDLAFMLHRLVLNGHPVAGKVRAFAEAQWARPSVRSFVEQKRIAYVPY